MGRNFRKPTVTRRGIAICGGAAIGAYALACGAIGLFQERILYPGAGRKPQNCKEGWTRFTSHIEGAGEIEGFHRPAQPGMPTIMYLHGNGSGLEDVVQATETYCQAGYGILVPEYPGYWGNPGRPREHLLAASAKAAMQWIEAKGISRHDVIIVGNSIGSGPAINTAIHGSKALVLISGVAHMRDLARLHFGYVPSLFLRDRYHNEALFNGVELPVFVIHGTRDRLVPVEQGRRLAAASSGTYHEIDGGEHDLTYHKPIQEAVLAWIEGLHRPAMQQLAA